MDTTHMRFRITYVNRRPSRIVSASRFTCSSAFFRVLQLNVGESIDGGYRSAGYKSIKRIA